MVPYSINKVEATSNLFLALGFLKTYKKSGVFIAINGMIDKYNKIYKDKSLGKFYES
jgi:L-asparaginase